MNQEEAEKCIQIGLKFYQQGEYDQAIKYFHKSNRLHPTEQAWKLIAASETLKQRQTSSTSGPANNNSESSKQQKKTNNGTQQSTTSTAKAYTAEQLNFVKEFNKKTNFYEIMGVSQSATNDELKKQYRKLALKLHPDKNKAPQADEAFKKLNKAYECLTNPQKKELYDRTGRDEPEPERYYERSYSYDTFEGGMGPEDIFDFLFQSQFGPQFRRSTRTSHQRQQQQRGGSRQQQQQQYTYTAQQQQFFKLFQYLPVIFIVFSFLAFNFNGQEQIYSTVKTYKYNIIKYTKNIHAQYFVDSNFDAKYQSQTQKIAEIEEHIEQDYGQRLYRKCIYQQKVKQTYEYQARIYSGYQRQIFQREAENTDLSSCAEFDQIKDKIKFNYYF